MNIQYFRSKIVICLIALTCLYLFASPIWAQTECLDNLYYFDQTYQKCVHKHGGYFEPTINQCVYNFSAVDDCLCNINCPSPSPLPSITLSPTIASTSATPYPSAPKQATSSAEEIAINFWDQGTLPEGLPNTPQSQQQNFFQQVVNAIGNLLSFLNPVQYYFQATNLQQATIPSSSIGNSSTSPQQTIEDLRNGPVSLYNSSLPTINSDRTDQNEGKQLFNKANFPPGIEIF